MTEPRTLSDAWAAALPLAVVLAACDVAGDPELPPPQVRDSAGVRIVENAGPAVGEPGRWARLHPEPTVQIGEVEGDEPYLFTTISAAVQVPDGRIMAADWDTRQIRVFDEGGIHLRSFGRDGEGPGEFGTEPAVRIVLPDTVLAWDPRLQRLTWFTLDGEVVREESVRTDPPFPMVLSPPPWRLLPDGAIALMNRPPSPPREERARQRLLRGERYLVIRPAGSPSLHRIDGLPGGWALYDESGFFGLDPDLGPDVGPGWDVRGSPPSIVVADDPEGSWALSVYDLEGNRIGSIRAPVPRRAWTRELAERERERLLERAERVFPENVHAEFRSSVQGLSFPDTTRAIDGMRVDASDRLWVRRWGGGWEDDEAAGVYDVVDPDGTWLGWVEVDPAFGSILSIGEDHLLFRWTDPLGVQSIRRHALERLPVDGADGA